MSKELESALTKLRAHVLSDDHYPYAVINRKEAAALLAKIEAADRLEWQPIETAPKDGSPMLVCSHAGHVGRATYDAKEGCFQDEHTEFIETHWLSAWMPLPPAYRNPQPAGGGEKSGEFAPAPPDKTYQHALVRRLWEAQLGDLPDDVKRLMAEAATEIEGNLPATDDFVNAMRRKHAKVIR